MGTTNYILNFHTGDEYLAGTDSNIFVTLFGSLGQSDEYRMNGLISGNAFERNQIDTVKLALPETIGDVYHIELRSDCKYGGSGWLLDYIDIRREQKDAPTAHFSCRKWIENRNTLSFDVTSGLVISDDMTKEFEVRPSGELLHVPAEQSLEYKQQLSITTGYSLKETKITQIGTNTSASVEGGFGAGGANTDSKVPSLKAALSFALSSMNSTQNEENITFDGTKTIDISTTIENRSDKAKTYEIMVNMAKNQHKITIGGFLFEIPEYLSCTFAGVREVTK